YREERTDHLRWTGRAVHVLAGRAHEYRCDRRPASRWGYSLCQEWDERAGWGHSSASARHPYFACGLPPPFGAGVGLNLFCIWARFFWHGTEDDLLQVYGLRG